MTAGVAVWGCASGRRISSALSKAAAAGPGVGMRRQLPQPRTFTCVEHGICLALFVAQQADDDLFLTLLDVPRVAVVAVGVVFTFQITAGHVVEKQLRFPLPSPGGEQPLFNGLLVLAQPGEIGVEIVLGTP